LYLVDEVTMQPVVVRGSKYPVEITEPADFVPKLLPFLQGGLKALSVVNSIAGNDRQ
jgi:ADP-dependent phosphofructokinase/glucokinase